MSTTEPVAAAYYTPESLGEVLHCSADHVRELITSGELSASDIGRGQRRARWRITQAAVDEFLDRRANGRTTKPRRQKKPVTRPSREWV